MANMENQEDALNDNQSSQQDNGLSQEIPQARSDRSAMNKFEPIKAVVIVVLAVAIGFGVLRSVDSKASSTNFISNSGNTKIASTTTTTQTSGTTGVAETTSGNSEPAIVAVLNSTTVSGAASKIADAVTTETLTVSGTGNDSSENIGTTIYFADGFEETAQELAQDKDLLTALEAIGVNATIVTEDFPKTLPSDWDSEGKAKLDTANIILIIGKSL